MAEDKESTSSEGGGQEDPLNDPEDTAKSLPNSPNSSTRKVNLSLYIHTHTHIQRERDTYIYVKMKCMPILEGISDLPVVHCEFVAIIKP